VNGVIVGGVFALFGFGCALIGLWVGRWVIVRQLADEAKDIIGRVSGLVTTVIGLVLGLLISSGYSLYSGEQAAFDRMASQIIELDHTFAAYGPEANPGREVLRSSMHEAYDRMSSSARSVITDLSIIKRANETLSDSVGSLDPKTSQQSRLLSRATQLAFSINETLALASLHQFNALPVLFVIILGCWTGALFFSFGVLGRKRDAVRILRGLRANG
jgi:hypothetical protein